MGNFYFGLLAGERVASSNRFVVWCPEGFEMGPGKGFDDWTEAVKHKQKKNAEAKESGWDEKELPWEIYALLKGEWVTIEQFVD